MLTPSENNKEALSNLFETMPNELIQYFLAFTEENNLETVNKEFYQQVQIYSYYKLHDEHIDELEKLKQSTMPGDEPNYYKHYVKIKRRNEKEIYYNQNIRKYDGWKKIDDPILKKLALRLLRAAKQGDITTIQNIKKNNPQFEKYALYELLESIVDYKLRYSLDWVCSLKKQTILDAVFTEIQEKFKANNLSLDEDKLSLLEHATAWNQFEFVRNAIANNSQEINDKYLLKRAAIWGHLELLKFLLEKGANPNQTDDTSFTPLEYAAMYGQREIVKFLLNHPKLDTKHQNPTAGVSHLVAALHGAVWNGQTETTIELLKDKRINLNTKNKEGNTALIQLIRSPYEHSKIRRLETLKVLMADKRSQINIKNNFNQTALAHAAASGDTETVKLLLADSRIIPSTGINYINRIFYNGTTPLLEAARAGHLEVVKNLLAHPRTNPNDGESIWNDFKTPLLEASQEGHLEIVRELLKHPRIHPNAKGGRHTEYDITPLIYAARHNHKEIVQELLNDSRVDPNSQTSWNRFALLHAVQHKNSEMIKALTKRTKLSLIVKAFKDDTAILGHITNEFLTTTQSPMLDDVGLKPYIVHFKKELFAYMLYIVNQTHTRFPGLTRLEELQKEIEILKESINPEHELGKIFHQQRSTYFKTKKTKTVERIEKEIAHREEQIRQLTLRSSDTLNQFGIFSQPVNTNITSYPSKIFHMLANIPRLFKI